MDDYVFTLDKPGYHNEMLVSETLIDSSDAAINAALPTAKPGDVIKTASGAKMKRKDLDGTWKSVSGGGGGGGLPPVTDADNGKFMRVVDGEWAAAEVETTPMTVTYDDDTSETFNIFVESTTE